jgi:hypothetical protein
MRSLFSEGLEIVPFVLLVFQKFESAPVDREADIALYITQSWHGEWEGLDGKLAFCSRDFPIRHVNVEAVSSVLACVSTNNQDSFLINLARAQALSCGELALDGAWVQIKNLPFTLHVLLEHAHIETLNRIDVLASFIVNSTENEYLFTFEGTRTVVVALSG